MSNKYVLRVVDINKRFHGKYYGGIRKGGILLVEIDKARLMSKKTAEKNRLEFSGWFDFELVEMAGKRR